MMNEYAPQLSDQFKNNLSEINNNLDWMRRQNDSKVSCSSASSYQSDSSEDANSKFVRKASLEDIIHKVEDKKLLSEYKRGRSMSDGAAVKVRDDDSHFEVFPSLPNSVLEKMGLHGNSTGERFNEVELEQKFTSLALAFVIDAATIKDRCERQRRHRDRTEKNLFVEIERFKEKLALMQPLCTDYEKAELLSALFMQTDIIQKATALVSTAAERYGSVQHEERLAESVHLMVNHVQMLKQQRDSARRQLQYTKRVLQNSSDTTYNGPSSPKGSLPTGVANRKIICKRRASIATFSQQQLPETKVITDIKKMMKRTSDLSLRASSLTRNGRPPRLELGGELVKIKEGFAEPAIFDNKLQESDSEGEVRTAQPPSEDPNSIQIQEINLKDLSIRERIEYKLRTSLEVFKEKYQKWIDDNIIHEICSVSSLICFSFSILLMLNILVEYEYAKIGAG